MDFIFTGKITQVKPVISGVSEKTGKQWQRATYVAQEEARFPQNVVFDIKDDNVQKYPLELGKTYTLHLFLDVRYHEGNAFQRVECWRVDGFAEQPQHIAAPQPAAPQQQNPSTPSQEPAKPTTIMTGSGRLPF